jgi:hypothetical protein
MGLAQRGSLCPVKQLRRKALWKCPLCNRRFANRNQFHFCARYTVRQHLKGKSPLAISLFREFAKLVRRCGPVIVFANKTRIGFQVRMAFADVILKREWLDAYIILARRLENRRFTKIETLSPRNHIHYFRIRSREELDAEVLSWLREAYCVGQQRHLAD